MKVLVCGDIHGDWGRLNQLMSQKRPDIVLQCGDFGWWPSMCVKRSVIFGQRSWNHKGLKIPEGTKVYWCDGNHEDHWDLDAIRRSNGNLRVPLELYDNCWYCPRGSTLVLPDSRLVLFLGGATSIDRDQRTLGVDWFPEEVMQPCDDRYLESLETDIDIIVSHTVPQEWVPDVLKGEKLKDPTRKTLSYALDKWKPDLWYSGHWHKVATGKYSNTTWQSLDYPGHGGMWWKWIT